MQISFICRWSFSNINSQDIPDKISRSGLLHYIVIRKFSSDFMLSVWYFIDASTGPDFPEKCNSICTNFLFLQ